MTNVGGARLALVVWLGLFAGACGGEPTVTTLPSELTVVTYNMFYGLAAELVPETTSTGSLSTTAQAILNAIALTDSTCRVNGAAEVLAAERPDVIGLQEALIVAFSSDLDEHDGDEGFSDSELIVDFAGELVRDIARLGGPHYRIFQRQNARVQATLPLFGGLRIADTSAILVDERLPAKQIESVTFQTLEPAADIVPGTGGFVVRGALHVQVPFMSSTLELFNTHLQSGGDPAVREAQAAELAALIHATPSPNVILTGDLNDTPDSLAVRTIAAELTDTYAVAGTPPGLTAYQPQSLTDPVNHATVRIDYIFIRSGEVEESRLILDQQVSPCNLWTSDHFGVLTRFRTAATPPQSQPSE